MSRSAKLGVILMLLPGSVLFASGPAEDTLTLKTAKEKIVGAWKQDDQVLVFRSDGNAESIWNGKVRKGTYRITETSLEYCLVYFKNVDLGMWEVAVLGDNDLVLKDSYSGRMRHYRRFVPNPSGK